MRRFLTVFCVTTIMLILSGCGPIEEVQYSDDIFGVQEKLLNDINSSNYSLSNTQTEKLEDFKLDNDTINVGFIGEGDLLTYTNEDGEVASIYKSLELLMNKLFDLETDFVFYKNYFDLNKGLEDGEIHLSPFLPEFYSNDYLVSQGEELFEEKFYMVYNTKKITGYDDYLVDYDTKYKIDFIEGRLIGNSNRGIDQALLNTNINYTQVDSSFPNDIEETIKELESSTGYEMIPVYDIFSLQSFLSYENMGYFRIDEIIDLEFSGFSTLHDNEFLSNSIENILDDRNIILGFDDILSLTRYNVFKDTLTDRFTDEEKALIKKINTNGGIDIVNDANHPTFSANPDDNSSLVNIVLNEVNSITEINNTDGLQFNLIDDRYYESSLNSQNSLSLSYNYLNIDNSFYNYTKSFATDSVVVLAHIDSDINISSTSCTNDLRYGTFANYRNYSSHLYDELGILNESIFYDDYYDMSNSHKNKDFDFILIPKHTYLYRRNNDLVYFSEIVCTLENEFNSHNFIFQNVVPDGYTQEDMDTLNSLFNKSMESLDGNDIFDEWIGNERNINSIIFESNQTLFFSTILMNLLLASFLSFLVISTLIRLRTYKIKDSLTDLYNRAYMSFLYSGRGKMIDKPLAFIDVDKFKTFNDTYGHHVGDLVLERISSVLLGYFDPLEVFRVAGDEFVVIAISGDSAALKSKLEFVSSRLKSLITIPGSDIEVSINISVGITEPNLLGDKDLDEILDIADKIMYFNKSNSNLLLLDDSNNDLVLQKISAIKELNKQNFENIEVDLREVYDFNTKKVVGYEMISRMDVNGIKIKFYDYEKYISDMVSYTFFVYQTARIKFEELKTTNKFLTIYISESSLEQLSKSTKYLKNYQNKIIFELNEGTELSNSSTSFIKQLHLKGYKFLISNFEGGHSSLLSLRHSEFEYLKLTNRLINSGDEKKSEYLLEFIEGFTNVFNVKLFVDNIDSKETYLKYSKSKNISYGQGTYFNDLKEVNNEQK